MYVIIPYQNLNIDNLVLKNKTKRDKVYIKILYIMDKIVMNDVYILSPKVVCLDELLCISQKIKNKYLITLKCTFDFINYIKSIEKKVINYFNYNNYLLEYSSIVKKNIIQLNIFKDIYTGFNIYDKNNDLYPIENIKKGQEMKVVLAFNYVWINKYNYGISWRLNSIID